MNSERSSDSDEEPTDKKPTEDDEDDEDEEDDEDDEVEKVDKDVIQYIKFNANYDHQFRKCNNNSFYF